MDKLELLKHFNSAEQTSVAHITTSNGPINSGQLKTSHYPGKGKQTKPVETVNFCCRRRRYKFPATKRTVGDYTIIAVETGGKSKQINFQNQQPGVSLLQLA